VLQFQMPSVCHKHTRGAGRSHYRPN
jgi:hypothetical protein